MRSTGAEFGSIARTWCLTFPGSPPAVTRMLLRRGGGVKEWSRTEVHSTITASLGMPCPGNRWPDRSDGFRIRSSIRQASANTVSHSSRSDNRWARDRTYRRLRHRWCRRASRWQGRTRRRKAVCCWSAWGPPRVSDCGAAPPGGAASIARGDQSIRDSNSNARSRAATAASWNSWKPSAASS